MSSMLHRKRLEQLLPSCIFHQIVQNIHDKYKEHGGEGVTLTEAAPMINRRTRLTINQDLSSTQLPGWSGLKRESPYLVMTLCKLNSSFF